MIRDHSGHGHSQWQKVLMFPIGCDHTKNYVWMNNSIFLRPGSNDRLPIYWYLAFQWTFSHPAVSRVTLYTAGHLHTAVPYCSHSRAPIVHTAVPRENNEHGCVYLHCRAVCKLPGCVEGHPWVFSLENVQSLNVYFLWIFLRHDIPLTRQQYVNNNVTDTPKVISLYNSKYFCCN